MPEILLLPIGHYLLAATLTAILVLPVSFALFKKRRLIDQQVFEQERLDLRQALVALEQDKLVQLHSKDLELARLQSEQGALLQQLETTKVEIATLVDYKNRFIQMETRLEEQQLHQAQEKQLLEETKRQLFKEFESSANKLFEAKQQQFSTASRTNIETVLSPFKEQLKEFHKRVEDVYHKENSERGKLVGQIVELQKHTQKISSEANNLAAALKGDNKAQGTWGEIILERLLEQSGLEKGREYDTQKSHSDEAGKKFKPDVIVHLPEGKDIVIDSKVSLVDYERFFEAEDTTEKEQALKRHVDSLRSHIKGLSLKKYEQLEDVRTLDFVFIFVPIEAAYIAAIQSAPALFKEAYDKNIVLVSPSSLMVALRTVETLWRYEKQNSNAEKIADSAGKLYDQFVIVLESIDEIGKFVGKAGEAYDKTRKRLTDGRGNLVRRVESLRDLGAKTSRNLPEKIKAEATDNESSAKIPPKEAKQESLALDKD